MKQGHFWHFYSFAVSLLLIMAILAGCSTKGDFGRPRELKMLERTSDFITDIGLNDTVTDLDAKEGHFKGARKFALTKPEIILRDSAVYFHIPLSQRNVDPSRPLEPTAYAEYMTRADYTYGPSREGFLASQIKADYIWLKRFSKASRQVKIDDGERAYYLKIKEISLTNQDRIRTVSRIRENEQLVYEVFNDIDERIASYMYALERSPIETPGASMDKAKTALNILRKEASMARAKYDKLARRLAAEFARRPGSWRPIMRRGKAKRGSGRRGRVRERREGDRSQDGIRSWWDRLRSGWRDGTTMRDNSVSGRERSRGDRSRRTGMRGGKGIFGSDLKPLPVMTPKLMRKSSVSGKPAMAQKPAMTEKTTEMPPAPMKKMEPAPKIGLPEMREKEVITNSPMVIIPNTSEKSLDKLH